MSIPVKREDLLVDWGLVAMVLVVVGQFVSRSN